MPRPRSHLVRYHGLFAPNAKHRRDIVAIPTPPPAPDRAEAAVAYTGESKPTAPMRWMQRLRRVFAIDLRSCPRCAGSMRLIAATTEPGGALDICRCQL